MPCADSSTICARRQVTTEPEPRRTIRSSRLPSSLPISRSSTRAAIVPSRRVTGRESFFDGGTEDPLTEPANVAGQTTSAPDEDRAEATPAARRPAEAGRLVRERARPRRDVLEAGPRRSPGRQPAPAAADGRARDDYEAERLVASAARLPPRWPST